jgi:hypothetical protein
VVLVIGRVLPGCIKFKQLLVGQEVAAALDHLAQIPLVVAAVAVK